MDFLWKKGQKVSAARADNATAEGMVAVKISADGKNAKCVDAFNDYQASIACGGKHGGYRWINPFNRQYGVGDSDRGENKIGYYYCVNYATNCSIDTG